MMRFFRLPIENVAEVGRRLFQPALAPHRNRNGTYKSRPLRFLPSGVNDPVRTQLVEFGVAEIPSTDCAMCGDSEAIALNGTGLMPRSNVLASRHSISTTRRYPVGSDCLRTRSCPRIAVMALTVARLSIVGSCSATDKNCGG